MRYLLVLLNLVFILTAGKSWADSAFQWCDAKLPTKIGEKVFGKDNNGNVCIKIGIAIKDVSNPNTVAVELSSSPTGEPIINASCSSGMTEWDWKLYQAGYKQKADLIGNQLWIRYEK